MSTADAVRRLLDETHHRTQLADQLLDTNPHEAHDELMTASALLNVAQGLLEDNRPSG